VKSLTLGLDGTNPRFPRKPSATMLTYRLTGTTEAIGIDHDELDQCPPRQHGQQEQPRPIFAHHGAPRRRRRVADLQMWHYQRECSPTQATHESLCSTRPSASASPHTVYSQHRVAPSRPALPRWSCLEPFIGHPGRYAPSRADPQISSIARPAVTLVESATERGAGAGRSISRVCPNGPMSSRMVGGARDFRIRRTGPSACCTAIGHVG
jgi:hypothetical protein